MESNLLPFNLKMGGNPNAGRTLLLSDLFALFPGSFEKVIPYFEHSYHIAVYADNGLEAGGYRRLRHRSMDEYAIDLIDCLTENGLQNITYLAHSVNALLAFTAASKAPQLFEKIILINAFPSLRFDPQTQYGCGFAMDSISDLFTCLMLTHRNAAGEPAKGNIIQLTDILAKRFFQSDMETAQAIFRLLMETDCRGRLNNFQVPTLILQSVADKFSTSETGYFMYRNIPDSRILKIKSKGHLSQTDAPEEIVRAIEFFSLMPVY